MRLAWSAEGIAGDLDMNNLSSLGGLLVPGIGFRVSFDVPIRAPLGALAGHDLAMHGWLWFNRDWQRS